MDSLFVGAGKGAAMISTLSPARSVRDRLPLLLLAGALAVNLSLLGIRWHLSPSHTWNDLRLAPALALYRGLPVYATATTGVINTWIYGPLPLLVMWPASLARTAIGALQVAGAINILIVAGAVALVCAAWPLPEPLPRQRAARMIAAILCVACWPGDSFITLYADNLAVALGLGGALLLARTPGGAGAWFAAGCAVGALACKQTSLGIPAAQLVWIAITAGRPAAWRHGGRLTIVGLLAAAASGAVFGWDRLWFTLFELPLRFPWFNEPLQRLQDLAFFLFWHVGLPLLVMLRWRPWFWRRDSPLLLPALLWLLSLPLGLAGIFKSGGSMNSLQSLLLWMPPVVVTFLGSSAIARGRDRWTLPVAAAAAVVLGLAGFKSILAIPARPIFAAYEEAAAITRSIPGGVWFPLHPTITLYSDGAYYHDVDGLFVRSLCGLPVTQAQALRHLPPRYRAVALPAGWSDWNMTLSLIPAQAQHMRFGSWEVYTWPPAAVRGFAP